MTPANQLNSRPLIAGVPFYIPVTIPFTSTLNEPKTVYTPVARTVGDVEVLGAICDLESVQGQFTIDKQPLWSSENIPLAMFFGKPDGPKPIEWHQPSTRLLSRQRIRADLVNVGAEPEGTMVFICRQLDAQSYSLQGIQGQGSPDTIAVDSQFTGVLDEEKGQTTPIVDHAFIWRTLHSTLASAEIVISGIDGKAWMDDWVPVWALAGRSTSVIRKQTIQPVCLIPAGNAIGFKFKNAGTEASGKLFLGGQSIPV